MSYATTADTVKYISALRLAEITGNTANVVVDSDQTVGSPTFGEKINLFRDAALGNDLSGYTAQQQADVVLAIEVLQVALDSATSLINSYIVKRYPLPLSSYPDWIKEACASFANCALHDDVDIEAITARCEKYTGLLEDVASGKLNLFPATDESGTTLTTSAVAVSSNSRVFTESFLSKAI